MSAIIFDGEQFAAERERVLQSRMCELGRALTLGVLLFTEDEAGRVYVGKKREMAERLGIGFVLIERGMGERMENLVEVVRELSVREEVAGVMIQKPAKSFWQMIHDSRFMIHDFNSWWEELTKGIDPKKDVDCLNRENLDSVYDGSWRKKGVVLPATVRGVVGILGSSLQLIAGRKDEMERLQMVDRGSDRDRENRETNKIIENIEMSKKSENIEISKKNEINERTNEIESPTSYQLPAISSLHVAVVGRSELVGKPLAYVLKQWGFEVALCGAKGLDESTRDLLGEWKPADTELQTVVHEAQVVVSATGKRGLITADMVAEGAVVIDVGFPGADVDFDAVKEKAAFITPVPGGAGPVTVVSLLENLVEVGR